MKRALNIVFAVLLLLLPAGVLRAENPADLPIPDHYVNDFAHVLSPAGAQKIEDLCLQVQQKADAQLFVVTIKTLDNGMTKEEFTDQLEEHWKAGKKGVDREALFLLVLQPRGTRIETGYGLEGILNDAKVGAILDQADPIIKSGDYDDGLYTGIQGLASVVAADKGVTLTQTVHTYHYQQQPARPRSTLGQFVIGIGFVLLIVVLARTGNLGWAIWLVLNLMGGSGGGGGGGRDDDDRGGGGFGGIGGGSSGGGGASRDF